MITIIAEITCEFCDLSNSYVIEDMEELLDVIIEDNWLVDFDDEGNIANTYCCSQCKEEYSEDDKDITVDLDDDEWQDELEQSGMHIERF